MSPLARLDHGDNMELWSCGLQTWKIFLILYLSLIVAFYLLFLDN